MVAIRYYLAFLLLGLLGCKLGDPVSPQGPASVTPPPYPIVAKVKADPCPLTVASWQVGVMEQGGNNSGTQVEAFLASVHLPKGYPWCAAFPHWCYRQCGIVLEPARSFAAAAAWHPKNKRIWEKNVGRGWEREVDEDFYRVSENGDLFALWYNSLGRIGHTGLIYGEDNDYFYTLEGNTNDGGDRDGDGVFKRKRLRRTIYCISRWEKRSQGMAYVTPVCLSQETHLTSL